ncbi:PREDICTED: probable pectinesterase/pectinesterase inhibitor 51 [Ipomoea nil]|uniref:probable pectinesterase/pectinesterase inhibitor 51 n=1 Tax=Ipomoea nil TaxID=35883 RepID=UPI000900D7BE|nr:PREDICTED: probable pectinesterase/pectinesterase inhibitor 51 [Ipomoea nil]
MHALARHISAAPWTISPVTAAAPVFPLPEPVSLASSHNVVFPVSSASLDTVPYLSLSRKIDFSVSLPYQFVSTVSHDNFSVQNLLLPGDPYDPLTHNLPRSTENLVALSDLVDSLPSTFVICNIAQHFSSEHVPIYVSPNQDSVPFIFVPLSKTSRKGKEKLSVSGTAEKRKVSHLDDVKTQSDHVVGDGFMASNITFENVGIGYQAVAFRSDADHTMIESCEFLGNQDTLYVKSLRQYYKSSRPIEAENVENNVVSAHGRIDPAQTIGFVFQNCSINGTEEYYKNPSVHHNYLGRPWKDYSRTVFIMCSFGDIISKDGWIPWQDDYALTTLYYGEFQNRGAGADTSGRVNWSSIIPAQHVNSYSVPNFIQGDRWIPKSAVAG